MGLFIQLFLVNIGEIWAINLRLRLIWPKSILIQWLLGRTETLLCCLRASKSSSLFHEHFLWLSLFLIQVSRLQYLNALRSSHSHTSAQSPDSIELKIFPNSQTQLLNDKNAGSGNNRVFKTHDSSVISPILIVMAETKCKWIVTMAIYMCRFILL